MLERLVVRNFKRFEEVAIDLAQAVVLVGPNNSGKTSALQALALWELGVRRWNEKRGGKRTPPAKRPGVTINRRDLVSLPVPETNLIWRNLHVREVLRSNDKQRTENVRIDIEVHGVGGGQSWTCGLEFDYANPESLYCRPLGWASGEIGEGPPIPDQALGVKIAYLPPMSGLSANEDRVDPGAIQVRLGEGRTAEVLRNLCYRIHSEPDLRPGWDDLERSLRDLFGVLVEPPEYIPERGELTMTYKDLNNIRFDISAAGRGLQQTLLLLAFLIGNPGSVLLLDEPDAHLEILRQRQIYNALTDVAGARGCQVIAATHSEVLLNEAADRDVVVAFVGTPHRIDDRGSQVLKALKSIGFEQYYLAEQTGWVIYLEGPTDLAVLRAFARKLDHPAAALLERPFVHYIENRRKIGREHFYGLKEAKSDLVGVLLTDRIDDKIASRDDLVEAQWERREIESYLCFPEVLDAYAESLARERSPGPLFLESERAKLREAMKRAVEARVPPAALKNREDRWWSSVKATDDFLDPVFEDFFDELGLANLMRKTDYHRLAPLVPKELLEHEIVEKLDLIVQVAERARPADVDGHLAGRGDGASA
jgi:ABC-type transport system involved in cytochrome c biogenesis ATPase subunit